MNSATFRNLDNKMVTIKVGDHVGFKADIEQGGKVVAIRRHGYHNDFVLTLENPNGFEGGYIGGQTRTEVLGSDTWTD